MRDVVVLAPNYAVFKNFAHQDALRESGGRNDIFVSNRRYIYPTRLENLLGLQDPELVSVGPWFENKMMVEAFAEFKKRYGTE